MIVENGLRAYLIPNSYNALGFNVVISAITRSVLNSNLYIDSSIKSDVINSSARI